MKPIRKIIALVLVFVTMFSVMVIPASATIGNAVDYTVGEFWDSIAQYWDDEAHADVGLVYMRNLLSAYLVNPDTPTAEELETAYDAYVSNLNTNIGSTLIGSDGSFYMAVNGVLTSPVVNEAYYLISGTLSNGLITRIGGTSNITVTALYQVSAPVDGYYTPYDYYGVSSGFYHRGYTASDVMGYQMSDLIISNETTDHKVASDMVSFTYRIGNVSSGGTNLPLSSTITYHTCSLPEIGYVRVLPDTAITNVDISPGTRLGSFTAIAYGYEDANGDTVVYVPDDSGMFNEDGGYLYNPITDETLTASSWTYDYENMRYVSRTRFDGDPRVV